MSLRVTPRWWFFMAGLNVGSAINSAGDGRAWLAMSAVVAAALCLWAGAGGKAQP